jgi:acyl-CoA thioester hydrolase
VSSGGAPTAAETFARSFQAGWGLMDFNGHMRNTAYLDLGADVRMMFFAEHGFPMAEFARLRIGPVVRRDELEYFREFRLLDPVRVDLTLAAASADGARFSIRNGFHREDGTLAARVTSHGGWLDLAQRKLTAPPDALRDALLAMPRDAQFERLG